MWKNGRMAGRPGLGTQIVSNQFQALSNQIRFILAVAAWAVNIEWHGKYSIFMFATLFSLNVYIHVLPILFSIGCLMPSGVTVVESLHDENRTERKEAGLLGPT